MPRTVRLRSSTHSDGAMMQMKKQKKARIAAPSIERRSPNRSEIQAAGTSPRTRPMPRSATEKAAMPVDACNWVAVVTRTGATAPLPIS